MSNCSTWPIDRTLSGTTSPGQSRTGSNGNEGVLCNPQSSSITGASKSECFFSYSGKMLWGGDLPLCRDAISVFYTHNWLGLQQFGENFLIDNKDYKIDIVKKNEISSRYFEYLSVEFLCRWILHLIIWSNLLIDLTFTAQFIFKIIKVKLFLR